MDFGEIDAVGLKTALPQGTDRALVRAVRRSKKGFWVLIQADLGGLTITKATTMPRAARTAT